MISDELNYVWLKWAPTLKEALSAYNPHNIRPTALHMAANAPRVVRKLSSLTTSFSPYALYSEEIISTQKAFSKSMNQRVINGLWRMIWLDGIFHIVTGSGSSLQNRWWSVWLINCWLAGYDITISYFIPTTPTYCVRVTPIFSHSCNITMITKISNELMNTHKLYN